MAVLVAADWQSIASIHVPGGNAGLSESGKQLMEGIRTLVAAAGANPDDGGPYRYLNEGRGGRKPMDEIVALRSVVDRLIGGPPAAGSRRRSTRRNRRSYK
jgi:hypothetical protein